MGIRPAIVWGALLLTAGCAGKAQVVESPEGDVGARARVETPRDGILVHVRSPRGHMPRGASESLRQAIERAVEDGAPDVRIARTGGRDGYVLTTRVADLRVDRRRGVADVSCSVTVQVTRRTGGRERLRGGEVANASASGEVRASTAAREVERASRDCVVTVAEALTQREVVPFLRQSIRVAARVEADTF